MLRNLIYNEFINLIVGTKKEIQGKAQNLVSKCDQNLAYVLIESSRNISAIFFATLILAGTTHYLGPIVPQLSQDLLNIDKDKVAFVSTSIYYITMSAIFIKSISHITQQIRIFITAKNILKTNKNQHQNY